MSNKPIFYDSDVLICFLEIDEQEILKKLFSKVIVPEIVYVELNRKNSPQNVKDNLKVLIGEGFVEIEKIEFATPEYYDYTCMIEGYWTNDQSIGFRLLYSFFLCLSASLLNARKSLAGLMNILLFSFFENEYKNILQYVLKHSNLLLAAVLCR